MRKEVWLSSGEYRIFGKTLLFHLLYRFTPEIRKTFRHNEEQRWASRYGILERITKFEEGHSEDGAVSRRRRYHTRVVERPGISEIALIPDEDDSPINEGHYFEFMDRASVAVDYAYQFLGSHPLLKKEACLRAVYDRAEEALSELYQEARRLESKRRGG